MSKTILPDKFLTRPLLERTTVTDIAALAIALGIKPSAMLDAVAKVSR